MKTGFLQDLLDLDMPIEHRVNRRLKHVYLQIRAEGLIVKTPGWSEEQIRDLLLKQKHWILRQSKDWQGLREGLSAHELPERVYFLGQICSLRRLYQTEHYGRVLQRKQELHLGLVPGLRDEEFLAGQILERFFKEQARSVIYPRLMDWACRMSLTPERVRFKRLKSRWGSCSSRRSINLNYRAIQLPLECIDAILVHELAHLEHLNHGRAFWALVHQYLPDYAERKSHMRQLEAEIL